MKTEVQIYEQDDNLEQEVVFDKIVTRYRYSGSAKPLINEINHLKEEIEKLKQERMQKLYILEDKEAKTRIKSLIEKFKSEGKDKIDIIDIINELNLPVEQVEKIMFELEKEKLVLQDE